MAYYTSSLAQIAVSAAKGANKVTLKPKTGQLWPKGK